MSRHAVQPCKTALISSGLSLVMVLASVSYAGLPQPPFSCSAPPQEAALAFFEFIETPGSESGVQKMAHQIFSASLLSRESTDGVVKFVASTKRTYGFDKFDRPLSQRLAGEPQVSSVSDEVSIRILALSPRGKVEQRVSFRCEDRLWKVLSFSYGPPAS